MKNYLNNLWAKISQGWTNIKTLAENDLSTIWTEFRIPLILLVVILTIKFRDLVINLIVGNAKKLFNNTQKQSQVLQTQENKDNQQANALVQEAENLSDTEKLVDENWNKNEK